MKIPSRPLADQTLGQKISPSPPSSARPEKPVTSFSAGQLLSGRVLALQNDGRVLLDIDGRPVTAFSTVNLRVGEKVDFVVNRGGDLPWLALKNEGPAQHLFRLLATNAVGRIADTLEPQYIGGVTTDTTPQFTTLLPSLQVGGTPGIDALLFSLLSFAPSKTTELTAAFSPSEKDFLQLLAHLEKLSPQPGSDQGAAIRQFVSLQQAFLGFNQQAQTNLLFIVPLFFAGKSGWGEWLVRQEGEQKANQRAGRAPLRFDFFLHLSNLGEIHLALLVKDQNLTGTFFLDDQTVVKHVSARLQELQRKLTSQGFEAPSFSCRLKEQNNQLRLKTILEESANTPNLALVDLTA